MAELLSVILAFPTVFYTGLVGLALLYWLFVIFGAIDMDAAGAEGAADGALGALKGADGAVGALKGADGLAGAIKGVGEAAGALKGMSGLDGSLEGADGAFDGAFDGADGALDGADGAIDGADGALDGADGALDGADGADALDGAKGGAGVLSTLLSALNLRRAPITVVFSLISFFGWILSFVGVRYLGPVLGVALPDWAVGALILVGSFVAAVPATSLATKPLEPLFKLKVGPRRQDYVGTVCRISTGRVDGKFGQATVEDGAGGLIIQVRIDAGAEIKRGDQALIIDYDREREAYVIEAYDAMVEEEASQRARK